MRLLRELVRRRAELDELEERLGFALPADLRVLYRVANGDETLVTPLFDRKPWIRAEEVGDEWAEREWENEPQRDAALDAVPRLWALDVSGAPADLTAIAGLPGLRHLVVTRDQWRELWHRDDLPPLAVV
ncbi:SMI1/KNR4 family protein, partial [Actinomadura kijaniata]|uniref:SMI1/KNR4 family protein n=1 Tax=Actinomadura kijaniata TaxID=46161 RepID=UPI003F1A7797